MVFEGLQYQCSKKIFYLEKSEVSQVSIMTSGASIY